MMQGSASPVLSAHKLACRRGDRLLFRGLSFELKAGEALHITGANGTGKTTLIRTLAGLMDPFSGQAKHEGAIGLIDERPALDPDRSLGAALAFWQQIDRIESSSHASSVLRLEALLEVPVRYLSTGQRKRAAFAVLINRNVPIWLLDEPLSGLDRSAIEQVFALIQSHVGNGGIALVASHQSLEISKLDTLAIEDFIPLEAKA